MGASGEADSQEFEDAAAAFRSLLKDELNRLGCNYAWLAKQLHIDRSVFSRYLTGERRGIVKRPKRSTAQVQLVDEPIIKNLLRALGDQNQRPLLEALHRARAAALRQETQSSDSSSGATLTSSHLTSCLNPPVPPAVVRAVGAHDVTQSIHLAERSEDLSARARAFAYLFEANSASSVKHLFEQVLREVEHANPTRSGVEPATGTGLRPAEAVHLRAILGVALCRAAPRGPRTHKRGVDLISLAGRVGQMIPDPLQRAHALSAVATAASLANDTGEERQDVWLQKLLTAADVAADRVTLSFGFGARLSARAATAQSRARCDPETGRTRAQELESQAPAAPDSREERRVLSSVAGIWAYVDVSYATQIAESLSAGTERDAALGTVAVVHAHQGSFPEALHCQQQIEQPWERARALAAISYERYANTPPADAEMKEQSRRDAKAACACALTVAEPHLVVHALAELAEQLFQTNRTTLWEKMIAQGRRVTDRHVLLPHERVHCFARMGTCAASTGRLDQAKSLCHEAEHAATRVEAHERTHAQLSIAAAWYSIDEGVAVRLQSEVEGELVELKLRAPSETIHGLVALAALQSSIDDLPGLRASLDEALAISANITIGLELDHALRAIIEVLGTLEDREQDAFKIATDRIGDPLQRTKALVALARANDVDSDSFRAYEVMIHQALQQEVTWPADRAEIRRDLAYALIESHDLQRGRQEIEGIEGHWQGAGWGRLASAYAQTGQFGEASSYLRRALGEQRPAWAAMQAITKGAVAIASIIGDGPIEALIDESVLK